MYYLAQFGGEKLKTLRGITVLVLGGEPVLRAGVASFARAEFGAAARIVDADWPGWPAALAMADGRSRVVVAYPGTQEPADQWAHFLARLREARILLVLAGIASAQRALLERAAVQVIALAAPATAWRRVLRHVAERLSGREASAPRARAARLTARQLQVLGLVSRGLANKAIAEQLTLSVGTVKLHVAAVLRALSAKSRLDVVLRGDTALHDWAPHGDGILRRARTLSAADADDRPPGE